MTGCEIFALVHLAHFQADTVPIACEMLGLVGRAEELAVTNTGRYLQGDQAHERILLYQEFFKCSQVSAGSCPVSLDSALTDIYP